LLKTRFEGIQNALVRFGMNLYTTVWKVSDPSRHTAPIGLRNREETISDALDTTRD